MVFDQGRLRFCRTRPRVFVITDIANEPDDTQSLVRLLLYGNEFDIRGIVACTSTWLRTSVYPGEIERLINAYVTVVPNLNTHVHPENQYPGAGDLLGIIRQGPPVYGKRALDPDIPLSDGAELLIEQLSCSSNDPLWVLCWGGTNVLAQALQYLHKTQSVSAFTDLRSRIRVYAISDQDDTGLWIRTSYPDIFYICSVHAWNSYALATWTGISGDLQGPEFPDFGGPDTTKVSPLWVKDHIQKIGPLGSVYPDTQYIMEGDTPTFLYLIQNGLGCAEHPGGEAGVVDRVVGADGRCYVSNRATIWRWREAYQNDFAARMRWTVEGAAVANHAPVVVVNGDQGPEPLMLFAEAGESVFLDASDSYDPDGDQLTFRWFQYREPTAALGLVIDPQVAVLEITSTEDPGVPGGKVRITVPGPEHCAVRFGTGSKLPTGQTLHVILEVKDNGLPCLYSYKRIVIQVTNAQLLSEGQKL
ncbi:hypothetical protein ASPCAL04887 [Aspergillus calidoustus]|uniref:Cellulose-binding protein n=1 Tax=Aspergillus calidoustus TaxID=454130 RepID=A0A0U5FYL4_ASPCI|nr:hypothetical protein ASPCAL04887 [Aspergillus calidoustus]